MQTLKQGVCLEFPIADQVPPVARKVRSEAFCPDAPDSTTWRRAQTLGSEAREMAAYQAEPAQMASGAIGKNGYMRMSFSRRDERTAMIDLEHRTPYMAQRALYWDEGLPNMACVYIITTSGGTLQGDRISLEIDVEADAYAHITTQGMTKVQTMDTNYAAQAQTFRLSENAYLEFMPDPIIPFRNSKFITETHIVRHPSATLIYSEILLPGRRYHRADEYFGFDVFSSCVKGFDPSGQEQFCEKYILEPERTNLRQVGIMGAFDVYANVLFLTPKANADAVHDLLGTGFSVEEGLAWGASKLPNDEGLVFKVLGNEVKQVKDKIRDFWIIARKVVTGAEVPPQFLWR
jgi:urease accessory protein